MATDAASKRTYLAHARRALQAYDLPRPLRLRFIFHGENTTIRVYDRYGRSYLLRLCRPGYQTPRALRGELAWLRALGTALPGRTPLPIAGRDGDDVQRVEIAAGQFQNVTLFHWLHGRFARRQGSRAFLVAVGELTALLHDHGATWRPRGGSQRLAYTPERLVGEACRWGPAPGDVDGLTTAQRGAFGACSAAILERLGNLPRGRKHWGMIHADLHLMNVLWVAGRAGAIDFDDCGPGWFVMDPATTLGWLRFGENYPQLEAAWLEGYTAHRDISSEMWSHVPTFTLARELSMVSWMWTRRGIHDFGKQLHRHARRLVPRCKRWLRTDGRQI